MLWVSSEDRRLRATGLLPRAGVRKDRIVDAAIVGAGIAPELPGNP